MYTRLAGVDDSQQQPANRARQGPLPIMTQSDPEGLSLLQPNGTEDPGHVACRRMCAYNFPCMVMMFGADAFRETLLPILETLCVDPDEAVRSAIAAGFHELVVLLPDEMTLITPFIELIRGGEADVVGHLTRRMDRILPCLYRCALQLEQADANGNVQQYEQPTTRTFFIEFSVD
uniref:Uncharacterized protein n=1 Tax=Plectus sambesii TaxID=2011161 RepID=A0A914WT00_9BILA